MAANIRIRIEPDIETYLRSQSERVLGVAQGELSATDVTTLTNRVIYEHKLAQSMMRQEFIPRILSWLKGVLPATGNRIAALPAIEQPALTEAEDDLDFAADFAAQFDE